MGVCCASEEDVVPTMCESRSLCRAHEGACACTDGVVAAEYAHPCFDVCPAGVDSAPRLTSYPTSSTFLEFDSLSEFGEYAQQLRTLWSSSTWSQASAASSQAEHSPFTSIDSWQVLRTEDTRNTYTSSATKTTTMMGSASHTVHGPVAVRGFLNPHPCAKQRPCLVAYRGEIFDLTSFAHEHPGGASVLHDFHGHDISGVFHDGVRYWGHSLHAENIMRQFYVGRLRRGDGVHDDDDAQNNNNHSTQRQQLSIGVQEHEKSKIYDAQYNSAKKVGLVTQVVGTCAAVQEETGCARACVKSTTWGLTWLVNKLAHVDSVTMQQTSPPQTQHKAQAVHTVADCHTVAYPRITPHEIIYRTFTLRRDRGLLWQVIYLSLSDYKHLINTPIYVPSCKLFDTTMLEPLTKTPFWVVPAVWLPLSAYWFARGVLSDRPSTCASWRGALDAYVYYPNDYRIPFYFHRRLPCAANTTAVSLCAKSSSHTIHHKWAMPNTNYNYHHNNNSECVPGMAQNEKTVSWAKVALLSLPRTNASPLLGAAAFHVVHPIAVFIAGLLLWTWVEYVLHRMLFHMEIYAPDMLLNNPLSQYLHFVFHGVHHVLPMDHERLLFPPPLLAILVMGVYYTMNLFITGNAMDILISGTLFGYVCYDLMHYSYHHCRFRMSRYMTRMKSYHMAHHYEDDTRNFGVTTTWWDIVWGTQIAKEQRETA